MEVPVASSANRSGKRGGRGRESGTGCRVSPRTADPWNTAAVKHAHANSYWLGTGEGERKCDGLFPQKKREEPSYFRGSIPTGPRLPSSSAQPTTQPGTGTMPDAGGVGGGGHAPRLHTVRIPPTDTPRLPYRNTFHLADTAKTNRRKPKGRKKNGGERVGF